MNSVNELQKSLEPYRNKLVNHTLYSRLNSEEAIHHFMKIHIFAVWDFMILVKHLQRNLTSVDLLWKPTKNRETRRFINEIVLAEESDVNLNGESISHFELYKEAMETAGVSIHQIDTFISELPDSLINNELPSEINKFISFTIESIQNLKLHEIAAIFTFGRENLIPSMFIEIVKSISLTSGNFNTFIYYLERHIELDSDDHGPVALQMVEELCGTDPVKWDEALNASIQALHHRINLWDFIQSQIEENQFVAGLESN